MNSTNTIGYQASTPNHLILDAGAIYKNYGLPGEALIGATSGGTSFEIKPKYRDIKVDGIKSNAKGLIFKVDEEVTLKVSVLEINEEILQAASIGNVDLTGVDYNVITGKTSISSGDYFTNIALVAKISGSAKPVVIILKNAIVLDGLKLKTEDDKDNTIDLTFTACIDPSNPTISPYEIRFPKVVDGVSFYVVGTPIIDNNKVLLTFSDTVAATVPKDGFAVTVAGSADVVTASTRGVNALNTILLTLTTNPTSGQAVTVAYTKPELDANDVKSASGVALNTFAAMAVTNN